jgi:hypothetical protein
VLHEWFNAALTVYKQDNIDNLRFASSIQWHELFNAALTVYKQGNIDNLRFEFYCSTRLMLLWQANKQGNIDNEPDIIPKWHLFM